jgi:hypothetical protein
MYCRSGRADERGMSRADWEASAIITLIATIFVVTTAARRKRWVA